MNAKQVSIYLRVHPFTIKNKLLNGELEGTKTDKGWEISQEQLNNYLKKNER